MNLPKETFNNLKSDKKEKVVNVLKKTFEEKPFQEVTVKEIVEKEILKRLYMTTVRSCLGFYLTKKPIQYIKTDTFFGMKVWIKGGIQSIRARFRYLLKVRVKIALTERKCIT